MKERLAMCQRCRHNFHAMAPCTTYCYDAGGICECKGTWYEQEKAISGFCYILGGTSVDTERAAHAACPGADYYYPCECECHDGV